MTHSNETIETEILVIAAQNGKLDAVNELVNRWQKKLWLHAYRICRNQQASWDITQESWLAIIRGLNKLHDPALFKPWAYKITTNKSINWINKKCNNRENTSLGDMDIPAHQNVPTDTLDEFLLKLDLNKRTVVLLYYYENIPVKQISKILNIPEGTVKSRLANARSELKQIIEKERTNEQ